MSHLRSGMRVPLALLALVALPSPMVSAQSPQYRALVEEYREDPVGAVTKLDSWDVRKLEREIGKIGVEQRSRRAGIMLHTERALADLAVGRQERGELHLAAAAGHLDQLADGGDDFRRRWHVAVGAYLLLSLDPLSAEGLVRRAEDGWPDDPEVLVLRGAVHEFLASLPVSIGPGASLSQSRPGDPERLLGEMRSMLNQSSREGQRLRREIADRRRRRERAETAYRKAVALDEKNAEAHLRLGRVLQFGDRQDAARRELSWVVDYARSPDLTYLAGLFIGRMDERDGDLRAAEASYRLAAGAIPGAQAATVALSHLLLRRGNARAARTVSHSGLEAQRELSIDSDPFWFYPQGRPVSVEAFMARLRHEARTGP